MKVKCIKPADQFQLTVGEEYKVINTFVSGYKIYNHDIDYVYEYPKEYFEIVQETSPITYKDFLTSMPKESFASVLQCNDGTTNVYAYDLEFICVTEERAEEVYAALITLFKEDV